MKIETLFLRKISKFYQRLLFLLLFLIISYNLYLKEYSIVLILLFLSYMISYEKKFYFTEKGIVTEYRAFYYQQDKLTPYEEIDKIEVYLKKEIIFLKVYKNIFYIKIPILNTEFEKLKKYLKENKVPIFEKNK